MNRPDSIERAQAQLTRIVAGWTSAGASPLEAGPNDKAFVDRYGLLIDGTPFDWHRYEHMVECFEDDHPVQVYQAGAQTGKTARLLAKLLRAAVLHWGKTFGYYFPDKDLPKSFSVTRFRPFVAASPELAIWLGRATKQGRGIDAQYIRTFGPSVFMFLTTFGRTSTESTPMQGTFFDEVRRMAAGDLQRAMERTSAAVDPIDVKVSTAGYPESDINRYFLEGDQRHFHTVCKCPEGVVLSLRFPDCVADLRGASASLRAKVAHAFRNHPLGEFGMTPREREQYGEAAYLCPKCGEILVNPRDGWWEPHNPGAYAHSYQMPQLLSWTYPAARCLSKWQTLPDLQELHNSMLGLAYLDAEAQPVQPEHLRACVNGGLRWTANMSDAWRRQHMRTCAMGVDAMGGYNCVVIKKLSPSGKHRTVHLEVAHGDDPWRRTAELMELYDVRVCVSDAHPHWNEALRFAKAFEGRVWLSTYIDEAGTKGKAPMVDWKDRGKHPKGQKGEETRWKYRIVLNRTNALKWSLGRWGRYANETPDPDGLVQNLPRQKDRVVLSPGLSVGRFGPSRVCRELYWLHQQRVAFRQVYASEEARRRSEFRVVAEHVGLDPHFAHANLYADVALQRIGRPRGMPE